MDREGMVRTAEMVRKMWVRRSGPRRVASRQPAQSCDGQTDRLSKFKNFRKPKFQPGRRRRQLSPLSFACSSLSFCVGRPASERRHAVYVVTGDTERRLCELMASYDEPLINYRYLSSAQFGYLSYHIANAPCACQLVHLQVLL